MISKSSTIFGAGHRGMVGAAVVRQLRDCGFKNLFLKNRDDLDLMNQANVNQFFADHQPEVVVFAAAKVGGIDANNSFPAKFLYQNLVMASNTVLAAWRHGTMRFLFLGSTCICPRLAPQPIASYLELFPSLTHH